jgi:hypothetical protein
MGHQIIWGRCHVGTVVISCDDLNTVNRILCSVPDSESSIGIDHLDVFDPTTHAVRTPIQCGAIVALPSAMLAGVGWKFNRQIFDTNF